VEALEI
jgi:hypothetical protein